MILQKFDMGVLYTKGWGSVILCIILVLFDFSYDDFEIASMANFYIITFFGGGCHDPHQIFVGHHADFLAFVVLIWSH